MLMPDSRMRLCWDIFCAGIIIWEMMAIPYTISFFDADMTVLTDSPQDCRGSL